MGNISLITGKPVTVKIGKNESELTFRPMLMEKQLEVLAKYDMSSIRKQNPRDLAKDVIDCIDSIEGVEAEDLDVEFLCTKFQLPDFFDICKHILGSGMVDEEQEKN